MEVTPTTTRRSISVSRPQSPTRLEEKRELNELNKRLETYTDRVRELSLANAELRKRIEHARPEDTISLRQLYEDQISQLRREIEGLNKDRTNLQLEAKKRVAEADEARKKRDLLALENENLDRKALALEQKIPDMESQISFKNNLLEEQKRLYEEKIRGLNSQLDGLKGGASEDLTKQLAKERKALKAQADEERERLLKTHNELIDKLQNDLANLETENTNLRVENAANRKEIEALKEKIANLQLDQQASITQLNRLKEELDMTKNKQRDLMKGKDDELRRLKLEMNILAKDFKEVNDSNVALDYEIQQYRKILSREESRLGLASEKSIIAIPSPNGPRAIPSPPQHVVIAQTVVAPVHQTPVSSRKRKPEEQFITPSKRINPFPAIQTEAGRAEISSPIRIKTVKNGIANIAELDSGSQFIRIANMTSSDIDLTDWWIQVSSDTAHQQGTRTVKPKRFKFPTGSQLPSEETIKVFVKITKDEDPSQSEDSLSLTFAMIQPGTNIQLLNAQDELISQVDIIDVPFRHSGDFDRVCQLM